MPDREQPTRRAEEARLVNPVGKRDRLYAEAAQFCVDLRRLFKNAREADSGDLESYHGITNDIECEIGDICTKRLIPKCFEMLDFDLNNCFESLHPQHDLFMQVAAAARAYHLLYFDENEAFDSIVASRETALIGRKMRDDAMTLLWLCVERAANGGELPAEIQNLISKGKVEPPIKHPED